MKTISIDIRPLLEQNWGGVSWYTYYLVDGLVNRAEQGELRLVLFYNQRKSLLNCSIVQLLARWKDCKNVRIAGYKLPNKILNLSMRFLNFPHIDDLLTIEQLNNETIDYFLAPNLNFLSLSKKTKLITVCHDLSFEIFPEFYTLRQKLWLKLINPRRFYNQVDRIIAVSQNTKQDLIDLYGINSSKIDVTYPGIDHYQFKKIDDCATVKNKYALPEKFILFVGTLEPRKNIETLIEAYDLMLSKPDFGAKSGFGQSPVLYIIGKEGWKYDRIYRFWLKTKRKDKIIFLDNVLREDLPALYNLATIFVYPSFYEGFGFPPLEAMACGTPVIVGDNSSLTEIVGDAGLLVDPFNIADLAQKMQQLLKSDELCGRLRTKGLTRAKMFTWRKTVQKIVEAL